MRKALSAGKRGNRVITMLELLFVMTAAAISASGQETNIKVEIPFNFIVGERTLPAGEYTVGKTPRPGRLLIQSIDGRSSIVAFATPTQSRVDREEDAEQLQMVSIPPQ